MKNEFLLLLIAVLFNCLTASAQSWLWGEQGFPALKTNMLSGSVATNRTGNVYHIGGFVTSMTFGTYNLYIPSASIDNTATYLVKYDQNGNILWVRQSKYASNSNGTPSSNGTAVASDDSDNAYITGYAVGGNIFEHDTLFTTFGGGFHSVFLIKYDHNGNVVWAKQPSTIDGGAGLAVATDKFGHEYVAGMYNYDGSNNFGSPFLIKYDRNGNIVWTVKPDSMYNSNPITIANSVATDISGNVYISGQFEDSLRLGSYKLYSENPGVYIAKFDSNGNVLWAQQSTNNLVNSPVYVSEYGTGFIGGYSVATDRSGAVYLTGPFTISITFGSYTFAVRQSVLNDFFLVKYNPGGTIAWGKEATPLDSSSWGSGSICTDDSNYVYISGVEAKPENGSFTFGNDTLGVTNTINQSYSNSAFLLKLDSSGNAICGSMLPSGGSLGFNGAGELPFNIPIASDSTGKFVYIGGEFDYSIVLGNDTLTSKGASGFNTYVGRWQACGCNLVISGTPLQTICSGYTATLTARGATSYTWSPAATLSSSTGDSVVADPVVTTTYIVTGINSFTGCEATAIDTIYVLEGVNIPIITQDGNILISSSTNDNQWFRNDSILTGQTGRADTATIAGWYKVEAINPSNGCNTVSDSIYVIVGGIAQVSFNGAQLSVYPNPTAGEIVLTISPSAEDVKDWSLQIADVLGQTVYTRSSLSYSNDIDLSGLPGGVYFITVISKTEQTVVPVVRQ